MSGTSATSPASMRPALVSAGNVAGGDDTSPDPNASMRPALIRGCRKLTNPFGERAANTVTNLLHDEADTDQCRKWPFRAASKRRIEFGRRFNEAGTDQCRKITCTMGPRGTIGLCADASIEAGTDQCRVNGPRWKRFPVAPPRRREAGLISAGNAEGLGFKPWDYNSASMRPALISAGNQPYRRGDSRCVTE